MAAQQHRLPATIKIPEFEFGAKRVSLPQEIRKASGACQFHRNEA
jgi:hypothetical protein